MLQFMGSQRVGHNLETEQKTTCIMNGFCKNEAYSNLSVPLSIYILCVIPFKRLYKDVRCISFSKMWFVIVS